MKESENTVANDVRIRKIQHVECIRVCENFFVQFNKPVMILSCEIDSIGLSPIGRGLYGCITNIISSWSAIFCTFLLQFHVIQSMVSLYNLNAVSWWFRFVVWVVILLVTVVVCWLVQFQFRNLFQCVTRKLYCMCLITVFSRQH